MVLESLTEMVLQFDRDKSNSAETHGIKNYNTWTSKKTVAGRMIGLTNWGRVMHACQQWSR